MDSLSNCHPGAQYDLKHTASAHKCSGGQTRNVPASSRALLPLAAVAGTSLPAPPAPAGATAVMLAAPSPQYLRFFDAFTEAHKERHRVQGKAPPTGNKATRKRSKENNNKTNTKQHKKPQHRKTTTATTLPRTIWSELERALQRIHRRLGFCKQRRIRKHGPVRRTKAGAPHEPSWVRTLWVQRAGVLPVGSRRMYTCKRTAARRQRAEAAGSLRPSLSRSAPGRIAAERG